MCQAHFMNYTLFLFLLALLSIFMWLGIWMERDRMDRLKEKGIENIDTSVFELMKFITAGLFVLFFCLLYHFFMLHFVYRRWPDVTCCGFLDIAWDFCREIPFNNWFNRPNQQMPPWIPNWFDPEYDDNTMAPPASLSPPSTAIFEPNRPRSPPPPYDDAMRTAWQNSMRRLRRNMERNTEPQEGQTEDIEMQLFTQTVENDMVGVRRDENITANEREAEDFTRPLPYVPPTIL